MKKTREIETSLAIEYREKMWGLERIVLDTVSNHLPADSGGTSFGVELMQDYKWIDFRKYDAKKQVVAARIRDNGVGYDYRLLNLFYSTKTHNKKAVGQFGEGVKLVAAACLRNRVGIEYISRDWSAVPYAKTEVIDGKRIQRLCFSVQEGLFPIQGSVTIFYNPSPDLLAEMNELPNNLLALNSKYSTLSSHKTGSRIINLEGRKPSIFIKGVRLGSKVDMPKSVFSYDLWTDDIAPDRQIVSENCLKKNIERLLLNCTNREVYKAILNRACKSSIDFVEFIVLDDILWPNHKTKKLWQSIFHEVFGEKAVICSGKGSEADKEAAAAGYCLVPLNYHMSKFLKNVGIKTSEHLLKSEKKYEWIRMEELSEKEDEFLKLIPKVNRAFLGYDIDVDVRFYEKAYNITRGPKGGVIKLEPLEKELGAYFMDGPMQGVIGIKRKLLENKEEALLTYLHELGHKVTSKLDYNREFTDFFIRQHAKRIISEIGK